VNDQLCTLYPYSVGWGWGVLFLTSMKAPPEWEGAPSKTTPEDLTGAFPAISGQPCYVEKGIFLTF